MLIGQYRTKVSPKGRLAFPKRFREVLGDNLVVTVGYENSLMVVSAKNYKSLVESTEGKPVILNSARDTARFLLGEATEIDLDEQGRCVLPSYLRAHARIGEEAIFLGLNKYVEIWDKQVWDEYQKYLKENINKIAEKLSNVGQ
ncbi:division/cell wall cluster transcriptional repressor MraZ [Candidatus Shapirobacteria bacterium CG03_land_8_20_14_0_80_40_19]|uniref:Transcriptional regulator MraZ n=4 Tax=Candidatus Shapironibacteriota TaxID=1752721 RepID=A0A2M7BB31_9BACT|nr:MAG: division/cell wall cluster transcriptional repressor MraZ [Candidatus Shapirobacteria bacterium CG11_big_fil_rev_8_21_14_0_20_40_12]PIV00305.1 MAG: division/cell wall cluster transcriptional repressor MraZ [Candidatus Shapirobacteria bacterium CG03_land_8_20_14_0_80_40_19]PJC28698.1 MAG: division/cell wall cluster transcriptional repressor MraZ [Candidatus Shapirobacteria bacterium CG_4_9_14_0_2_um_filter_40_11]PJC76074.1 MAG: division/cell wall cluster transcriptional repressor MraZ [Ca